MKNHLFCIQELLARGEEQELSAYLEELNIRLSKNTGDISLGNDIADAICWKRHGWPKKEGSGSLLMEKFLPKQKSFPQIYVPSLPTLWTMPWNIWKIPDLSIPGSI